MTDPKYIADRDKALYAYTAGGTIYEEEYFRKGYDAGYSRANSELQAELAEAKTALETIRNYELSSLGVANKKVESLQAKIERLEIENKGLRFELQTLLDQLKHISDTTPVRKGDWE
jgi:hypothetical protein